MTKLEQGKELHLASPIQIQGEKDAKYEIKRKYKVEFDPEVVHNITVYREKYEKYLKMHNNTASKDVWKIYDHIAADIFYELYN